MGSPVIPVTGTSPQSTLKSYLRRRHRSPSAGSITWMTRSPPGHIVKLTDFLDHLNTVHENIQFINETEGGGHLPFPDDIYCNSHGSLGHKRHRKPTHTDPHSNPTPNTTLSTNRLLFSMLVYRARAFRYRQSLHEQLKIFRATITQNG